MRHHLSGGDEPGQLPPESWDALVPYAAFLTHHASTNLRIEVWEALRNGRREFWGLPGFVAISPRVRWDLRHHWRFPDHGWAFEGVLDLFRGVAYAEFWHHHGWRWVFRYLWDRATWHHWAEGRAHQLLELWLAWRKKVQEKRVGS